MSKEQIYQDNKKEKERMRIKRKLTTTPLINNRLMQHAFINRPDLAQLLINIILKRKDLIIEEVNIENTIINNTFKKKNIRLDLLAKTNKGDFINIEMQNRYEFALDKRASFYSSLINSQSLNNGESYEKIKENYVIFVLNNEKYIFKNNAPIYNINRYIKESSYASFNDNSHIIYVDASYNKDDDLGHLLHDLKETDSKNMYFEELAKLKAQYEFNEDEFNSINADGGIEEMTDWIQEEIDKAKEESIAIGEEKGRSEGEAIGKERGRSEGQILAYENMLKAGYINKEQYDQFVSAIKM